MKPRFLFLLLSASIASAGESTKPRDAESVARMRERATDSRKGLAAARDLAGYDDFKQSFRLGDAYFGSVNSMPESLFVELRSTKRRTVAISSARISGSVGTAGG